jgi:uncharacterized membrane protein YkoI
MHAQRWMTGLTLGTMALSGMIAVNPMAGSAQQNATPPAAQSASQSTSDQANGSAVLGTPIFKPQIDIVKAQEIALADQSGAVVTDVSLEGERGVLEYSVDLDNGNEVHVDATSGDILPDDGKDDNGNENGDENGNEDQGDDDNGHDDGSEGDDQDQG